MSKEYFIDTCITEIEARRLPKVLEVGVGIGTVTKAVLRGINSTVPYSCLDMKQTNLDSLQQWHAGRFAELICSDVTAYKTSSRFDLIISDTALNMNGARLQRFAKSLSDLLTPSGILLIRELSFPDGEDDYGEMLRAYTASTESNTYSFCREPDVEQAFIQAVF